MNNPSAITRRAMLVALLAALAGSAGCGRGGDASARAGASAASATPALAATPATAGGDGCPATGQWAECSLVKRLEQAGLVPRRDSAPASEPPLTARGVRYHVGSADLDVFLYADSNARRTDEARLDPSKYVAYDAPQTIRAEPTLIRSANLLAILHSRKDQQRERVSDAITAGAPQGAGGRH